MSAINLDPLAEMLERLERHLEQPHVSGELHDWSEDLVGLFGEIEGLVRSVAKEEHQQTYRAIVKNYPNLVSQVEKMKQDDAHILEGCRTTKSDADLFASKIRETEMAEQPFHASRERLVNSGLDLVIAVRKQRAAVSRWLSESLQRVNGGGD